MRAQSAPESRRSAARASALLALKPRERYGPPPRQASRGPARSLMLFGFLTVAVLVCRRSRKRLGALPGTTVRLATSPTCIKKPLYVINTEKSNYCVYILMFLLSERLAQLTPE